MTDNPKRYSDEELEEFRILINKKLEEAQREYDSLMGSTEDGNPKDETAIANHTDAGVEATQRAEVKRLADRQMQFIQKLRSALVRINNKTYGVCRVTGELIPKDRLRAVPHATLSIEAKNR